MWLISERSMNMVMFPIKQNSSNLKVQKQNQTIFELKQTDNNAEWNYKSYQLMDYLATFIKASFDEQCFQLFETYLTDYHQPYFQSLQLLHHPEYITDPNKKQNFYKLKKIYDFSVTIPIKVMLKNQILKNFTVDQLKQTIEATSNCLIKTNYQFRINDPVNSKKHLYEEYSNLQYDFEPLFEFDMPDEYTYRFKFGLATSTNSVLSSLFYHNICTGNFIPLNENFYKLTQNANMLYRRYFLPWPNICKWMSSTNACRFLNLVDKNPSQLNKTFFRIIQELETNSLIRVKQKTSFGKDIRLQIQHI